ncbi:hypothetical protein [Microbacterium indicum]|uniref:hypothetical protein n=1 Tax=Microbacterium indicum TaxID=358100 RepID=UPI000407678F|nr:hypothetical protein [Microbacterium indicum]
MPSSTDQILSWAIPGAVALVAAVVVVIAVILVVRGVRRGKGARARADAALASLGERLVELDDATTELDLEIGMASALYDGRPPASLRRARLTAQHTRDDAFAAYSAASADALLPAQKRAEAKRLTTGIDEAMGVIAAARSDNEAWIAQHASPAEQIAAARERIDALAERMGDPAALRAELERIADDTEWEDAAQADAEARDALAGAEAHWQAARDDEQNVRAHLTAAEKSLARAEQSAQLLEETHRLVVGARLAVVDEAAAAASAIRAASGTLQAVDPREAPRLAEAIRVASAALDGAQQMADRRPVTANERLARLRDRLDDALAGSRTQQQEVRSARSALPGTLSAARSALARAEAVVLDAEVDARVRLDSARRGLAAARQSHAPVEALAAARAAIADAEQAAVLARNRKRRR